MKYFLMMSLLVFSANIYAESEREPQAGGDALVQEAMANAGADFEASLDQRESESEVEETTADEPYYQDE